MMYLDEEGKKQFNVSKMKSLLKDPDIIKVLSILKNENFSELIDHEGTTLLHLCAKYNSQLLIIYLIRDNLLDVNFYINAVNDFNETPLMFSIQNNYDVSTWKLLLDAGADLWKIKNNAGYSALMIIIRKYRLNEISEFVMTELEKKCCDIFEIVDVLLDASCELHDLDLFKRPEITKLMIECGCQVNLKNSEHANNTALHIAARNNDVDNVKILLEFGADKYIESYYKVLPIHNVLKSDNPNPEIISLLWPDDEHWILKRINMKSIFGKCKEEVLQLILQHCNVNLNAVDTSNRTPLHYLAKNHNTTRHFWNSLEKTTIEVDAQDSYGWTPLHMAVNMNNVEATRFLLDVGADVNALDARGRSPLFCFDPNGDPDDTDRQSDCLECLELLMQNGADAQWADNEGRTVISSFLGRNFSILLNAVLCHLALLVTHGSVLNSIILNHINDNSLAKNNFTKYRLELAEMKRKKIAGSVTYLEFLIDVDERLQKYVKNVEVVKELSKCKNTSYFHQRLLKRFERAMEIKRWRGIAGQLIRECIEYLTGYDLIIEIILDFLDYSDWELMASTD